MDFEFKNKNQLFFLALILFVLIVIAYSNHFTNGFEFDDSHTIVHNEYIRDIKNIPLFFTDIKYYGTNPGNQGYNPVLTSFNAIDYWLAGSLDPVYFHADIFFFFVIQLVLMFFMIRNILDAAISSFKNNLYSLLITGFYGVHAANAETLNYIIMRSDSFSALCIVAALLLYQLPFGRKYFLYLPVMVIGMLTKEIGLVFFAILFFYVLLFEENVSLPELLRLKKMKNILKTVWKALPAIIVSILLFVFIRKAFMPQGGTLIADNTPSPWKYFYSQWPIILHYIGNFVLPLDLSADSDFQIIDTILNRKVLLSLVFILLLVCIAFITSTKKEQKPIAFGILWFFISLAPTSSFIPFYQISNDHRTFLPYIGLIISLGWWLRLLFLRYGEMVLKHEFITQTFFALYFIVISLHSYGTYQRNIVWSSTETLWHDAVIKSPNNGRVQMNYGLALMGKGQYEETLVYFKRALELMPHWAYIHINMGILREAMGFHEEAEQYFKNAILYQPFAPDGYYFYARWLQGKKRIDEAIAQLEKGKKISPGHKNISELLRGLMLQVTETKEEKLMRMAKNASDNPTMANYVELSLLYYQNGMMNECIEACKKAISIDPKSAHAYNNMCSAYNELEQWEKAAEAGKKAVELDSTFQRAKNNLKWALKNLKK